MAKRIIAMKRSANRKQTASARATAKPIGSEPLDSFERDLIEGMREVRRAINTGNPISRKHHSRSIAISSPEPSTPELVRLAREKLGVSQALFGQFLGVSPAAVASWERGKTPNGTAARILSLIRNDPSYFQGALRACMIVSTRPKRMLGARQKR